MANGNSVKIKIDGDASGFKKTLSSLGSLTTKSIAGMAKVSTAIAAAGKAISVMGVKYNAEIENLQTSFEVMTGSAEKATEVVSRLRKLGAETPYEMTDLASTTQLLMQYGFAADDAIDKMTMLGDVAQGSKEKMISIATGYAQMSSAGKVNLQDIKQMINGGFNPLQEISERTGESMASLYDRISKGSLQVDEITESMKAATSEGGKFFGSMEKQSKTLNGQLSTLKDNANQLLGTLTEDMSSGLRDELLPLANNLIGELQESFETGGVDGLVNAATDMIPDLLGMMTGRLEDAISGVTRWLPQGASKIMAAFPSALKSATAVVPQLTTAFFEIASTVVGDLVSMLPELAPVLGEGILRLGESIFTGAIKTFDSFGDGLHKALVKIGAVAPQAGEAFAALVESVDQETIDELKKTIDVDIDTEITLDDYQAEIDGAVDSIETALLKIPGLSEDERTAIKNAIIAGSGMDALQLAFDEMGVDSSAAVTAIETAQGNIDTVVAGLGLSEAAAAHVQSLIKNNASAGEIQKAIESFGVEEGAAATATANITAEMNTLNTTLADLGISPETLAKLRLGLITDKGMVELALLSLGLDPASVDTVLASYDTVVGTLTAGIDGIYTSIANEFTDGVPETDAEVQAAKASIEGIATEAQARIDKWYSDKVAQLQASGLEGDTLTTELNNAKATYDSLTTSLQSTTQTAITQTENMVGKSKDYCEGELAIMRGTFDMLKDITTQIDMLTDKEVSHAETSRKLTISGVTSDTGTQLEAFLITYKEYTDKIRKAEEDYLAAVDEARAKVDDGGSEEDYAAAERQAAADLASAKQHAANYYQQYIDQILAGIIQADPAAGAAIQKYIENTSVGDLASKLNAALVDAFNTNQTGETSLTVEDILGNLNIEDGDLTNIADLIGISPEQLMQQLSETLKIGGTDFGSEVSGLPDQINTMFNDLLKGVDVDLSGVAQTLATAIDSGYLLPAINGIDYTNAQQIFETHVKSALTVSSSTENAAVAVGSGMVSKVEDGADGSKSSGKSLGDDFGEGYVAGIKANYGTAYTAGYTLAKQASKGTAAGQDSASPSKIARGLGRDFGDGYEIGLRESLARAAAAAKQLTGNIATAASFKSIANINMPNLQQELAYANEQNKTPVYLDGKQIAEIQGHNNSVQLAWGNTRSAKGVGSR